MATRTPLRQQAARTPKIKLQPPRRPAAYVWRPRLERLLDSASERRLTVVVAGPGYGKSTLVAARALEHGWAWYGADTGDASLGTFARGLRDALLPAVPALADAIPEEAFAADADGLAASFGQALDKALDRDLVLVVDDVHELGFETGSARLLEGLSRQAPAELHLVLCSREEATFPVERLRGQGQALQIESAALAFTADEVEVLLLDAGEDFSGVAAELREVTGGWPAAVQLAAQVLAAAPSDSRAEPLSTLEGRRGPLFEYLAEEVFRRESPEVIELLRTIAPFERFTSDLCDALGVPGPEKKLAQLQRRGFVVAGGEKDDWLSLHALLRDFIRETWPLEGEERRVAHRLAGRWWETKGLWAEALSCWREAGEAEEIVRLFHDRGGELLDGGLADAVIDVADAVPPDLLDTPAKLLLAECHEVRGDKEAELRYLSEVVAVEGESEPLASFHFGNSYLLEGRYHDAIEAFLGGQEASHPMNLAFAAYAYYNLGELAKSRDHSMRALSGAREVGHVTAEAEAHMNLSDICIAEGDLSAAETHLGIALETTLRARNVLADCSARARLANLRLVQGRYDEALLAAEDALGLAGRIGFALFLAWALLVRGEVHRRLGRLDEAKADFTLSRARYERLGAIPGPGFAVLGLGDVHRERGDLAQARSAYEMALAIGQRSGDLILGAESRSGLARILVSEAPERAVELAEQAVGTAREVTGQALLTRGWVSLARGDANAAAADAAQAIAVARSRANREWLAEALELEGCVKHDGRAHLEEAVAIWRELGSPIAEARVELALASQAGAVGDAGRARKKLRRLGVRDGASRAAGLLMAVADETAEPLTIETLGGFNVIRAGEQVPAAEWKSKKARDLLKLLVIARGRPLTREQLIEALWPGESPERTGNRLSVALSTVRTVLDPERRFDPGYFVSSEKGSLRLRRDHVAVDVETFLAEAEAALKSWRNEQSEEARLLLEDAEQAYGGAFLAEDRYEDWSSSLRNEARAAYVEVARALAGTTEGQESARYQLRILEEDPYDEQAHVGLVSALLEARAHGEARRAYATYTAQMAEIGVEPVAFAALSAA